MRRVNIHFLCLGLFFICFFSDSLCQTFETSNHCFLFQASMFQKPVNFFDGSDIFSQPVFSPILNESHYLENEVEVDWIRHYFKTPSPGISMPVAIAVDDSGNVYVSGKCQGSSLYYRGFDIVTIKYNPNGEILWIVQYDSLLFTTSEPSPHGIALDNQGNVYVTGYVWDSQTENDYITIKYNSAGILQWEARYNGPCNSTDVSNAIAVDSKGNVYVTGYSYDSSSHYDYATIKYNPDGKELWVARYNGPVDRADIAAALKLDDSENVYVTGWSNGAGHDYATIKYNSFGEQQWVARYNSGPGGYPFNKDHATSLAIDQRGNVYVTGWSFYSGSATAADYATVKYNSSGEEQWVSRYNGTGNDDDLAASIAIDSSGNIYVTGTSIESGRSYKSSDITTVKYDSSGNQNWIARYNSNGNIDDKATDLKIDNSGNVIVTGSCLDTITGTSWDYVTISYSSSAIKNWVVHYNGTENANDEATALAIDNSGNIYVTGIAENVTDVQKGNYGTIKYDSAGAIQWLAQYNSGYRIPNVHANAFIGDNDGNIFISASTPWNIVTFKYDSNGNELWAASYADNENSYGWPEAITRDDYGNVYIAGSFSSAGKRSDYLIIKYNSIGVEQWVAQYDGTAHSFDAANAIAVDGWGNVYVTGSSTNLNTGNDYATIKFSSDGIQQWVACYNEAGNSQDQAYDIAVSQFGNIFVTGNSGTIKYNGEGAIQWIDSTMIASKIIVDKMENCYVTGKNTAKINSDGNVEWSASITGIGASIAVDDSGYVYVAGYATREGQGSNITTAKINFDGNMVWFAEYDGPINSTDIATALSIDNYGNVYVTGNSGSSTGYDFATIKYDPYGEEQWVARYDATGFYDETIGIAVDDLGYVYVAGTSYKIFMYDFYWSVVTTIKYSQASTLIEQETNIVPRNFYLSQNYPNPFNPTTTIRYALPKDSFVTLKVFNLLGQEVATLVDEMKPMGEHRVLWQAVDLPSGVYLYRLEANSNDGSLLYFNETKKFILLK